jgi:large-conductance mechanosensitive channel
MEICGILLFGFVVIGFVVWDGIRSMNRLYPEAHQQEQKERAQARQRDAAWVNDVFYAPERREAKRKEAADASMRYWIKRKPD